MQIDDFLLQYEWSHREFFPEVTTADCLDKLYAECKEFIKAYDVSDTDACQDEATDVMNTAIIYKHRSGTPNPLFAGYEKLEVTRIKYREAAKRQTIPVNRTT